MSSIFSESAFAQSPEEANEYNKVSIASPTAGSLSKFVDIPVSLHTGIPEISLPLYTIQEGPISLAIGMNYHSGGLKTLEPAGWVGAGWALNAGGAITRSVRGTPDEKGTVNNFQKFGFFSDYGYRAHLLTTDATTTGYPDSGYMATYEEFKSGKKDSEPDLFFFNFGGYSGKFYFNDDRTPMLLPDQDIKIEYVYGQNSSESIQAFILTTPDGVKYSFGATPSTTDIDPVEYTKVFTDQNGLGWDRVISSWFLNKITSPDGIFSINLTYHTAYYSYYTMSLNPTYYSDRGYKLVRNMVHGVELESITSSKAQINFIPSVEARQDLSNTNTNGLEGVNTTAKALASINILQRNSQVLLKKYKFSYAYFESDPGDAVATTFSFLTTDKKRLKLLSVQEESGTGEQIPPYQFEYFPEQVPRRMTFSTDHWGFNNGIKTNGNNLIGNFTKIYNGVATQVTGADRDPRWPAMRAGTISKLTFPTGGYNEYTFEPNEAYVYSINGTNGEQTYVNDLSAGMSGGEGTRTEFKMQYLDFHHYLFKLTNGNGGGLGHLNIYDSNNVMIDHFNIANNQPLEITRNYTAGTYKFELVKENPYSGSGVSLYIYQLAGTVTGLNAMVGGLRIKSIKQSAGNGMPDMVTSYSYNDGPNNYSTGVLFGKPTIAQVVRNDIYKNYITPNPGTGTSPIYANGCPTSLGSDLPYLVSAGSIRPMASTQGSHIGYRRVKRSQSGNGYSLSYFNVDGENNPKHDDVVNRTITTTPNTCTMDIPNYPSVPEPNSFKRGQLEFIGYYDNAFRLISDEAYSSEYVDQPVSTPAFVIVGNQSIQNGNSMFTWYDQKTAKKIKETTIRRSYSNETIETKVESFYDSPNHRQLAHKLITNSSGDRLETRYRYIPDYYLAQTDGLDNGLSNYNSQLAVVNNTFESTMANCYGSLACQRPAWLKWDVDLSHKRMDYINYRVANFTGANNTYAANLLQSFNNAGVDLKPIIDLRRQHNYKLVETVNLKNDQILNASINTFDYAPESSNQIYLSKISKTEFPTPVGSFNYASTASNNVNLNQDMRYQEKISFKYKDGNIAQVSRPESVPTSYLWGYNKQYPVAEVLNAQSNEVLFSSFEDSGSWDGNLAAYDQTIAHNGAASGRIDAPGVGEVYSMSNTWLNISLSAPKMFHYSGWIYSNGPTAQILLFMKKAGETGYFTEVADVSTVVIGKWTLIEGDYLVPANITQLNMRVDNNGTLNGGNKVWFDDVRIYPTDAKISTYTYIPLMGMTSVMDTKGQITYYEFDPFQRLKDVRNSEGNIIKHMDYHNRGQ